MTPRDWAIYAACALAFVLVCAIHDIIQNRK